jgi:dTDP-4-dehydrorhamnose 3,5-epimerase
MATNPIGPARDVAPVPFAVRQTRIPGLVVLRMRQIGDLRGTVREVFRVSALAEAGLPAGPWRQLTITETARGVIRGLHSGPEHKLISVVAGEALGAYVDTRPGSAAPGRVETVRLTLGVQVLVPPGVCSGFQAVSDEPVQYLYAVDREWSPGPAGDAVHPLDPALGIAWPITIDPTDPSQLSAKDAAQRNLPHAGETLNSGDHPI